MKLQTADHLPKPTPTDEDQLFRLTHHQVLTCCLPEATYARSINPTVKLFDYVSLASGNTWAKWVMDMYTPGWSEDKRLSYACAKWLDETHYDGLVLDEPFVTPEGVGLCTEIANAIAPRIVCPNFGDIGTYGSNRNDVNSLRFITKYHFVQVCVDTEHYTKYGWAYTLSTLKKFLNQGKTIVAGIYDPDKYAPCLASHLSMTMEHTRLYWHYASQRAPAVGNTMSQWIDPHWSILRGEK